MKAHRLTAYLLLIFVSIIWAIAGPVIKYVLGEVPPLPFLLLRFGISSLVALISFIFTGVHLPKNISTLFWLFIYGFVTSTVSLGLLFLGLNETTVLEMSLLSLIGPLLIALSGVLFLHEHITKREKIGMGVAFVGTMLTVLEPIISQGFGFSRLSGNLIIILYLLATTYSVILSKQLLRQNVSPALMTNSAFIVGFITTLPIVIFQGSFPATLALIPHLSLTAVLGIIFMALISGNLAYYLSNKAQKTIEIGEAGLFSYLYPLLAMPLAVIWLKEELTPAYILGAVIVAIGVIIAELKK